MGARSVESLAGCALQGSRGFLHSVPCEGGGPGAAQGTRQILRGRGPAGVLVLLALAVELQAYCLPFSASLSYLLRGLRAVSLSKDVIKGLQA